MTVEQLLGALRAGPVAFDDVMAVIDQNYAFTPTAFRNGEAQNSSGSNNGSCKIFAFAKLHGLDKNSTLNAFGDFYTQDVLQHPDGEDHANIRNFMRTGWDGVEFSGEALTAI
ncbi:hypothetical protein FHR99_001415 [Litorivivens lipolytica]|uniref:HopJ type III effector protein n=1 Tax=Litorivivens lipolytica TaxID=1524264 RepID=A0A7W4Z569_9GAMM|nr:HopJ type III effector protein [Litorivivens lipolytica]MBB3047179.1 hypothetical protein [Litorivivens lipolytica]